MKTRNLFLAALFFTLVAGAFALAQEDGSGKGENFNSEYAHAQCKADFTVGVIDSLIKNLQDVSLSKYSDTLKQDIEKIKEAAGGEDKEKFRDLVKTFDSDLKEANKAVRDARKTGNISNETKAALKTAYEELHKTYNGCSFEALKKVAEKRADNYKKTLVKYEERADNFAKKGLEISGMLKVIQDAKAQVYEPLLLTIRNANDTETLREAFRKYCLNNGCKDGVNFHLAVKFEMAKLEALIGKARQENLTTDAQTKLDKAQADLDAAKSLLANIGTSEYKGEKGKEVAEKLREVAKDIQEAYKSIRQAKKEKAEEKRKEAEQKKESKKEQVKEERKSAAEKKPKEGAGIASGEDEAAKAKKRAAAAKGGVNETF